LAPIAHGVTWGRYNHPQITWPAVNQWRGHLPTSKTDFFGKSRGHQPTSGTGRVSRPVVPKDELSLLHFWQSQNAAPFRGQTKPSSVRTRYYDYEPPQPPHRAVDLNAKPKKPALKKPWSRWMEKLMPFGHGQQNKKKVAFMLTPDQETDYTVQ
jgi:hypothetical protein